MNRRQSLLLYAAVVLLFATWALLPISWETTRLHASDPVPRYDTITILAPFIPSTLFLLSALTALILFMLGLLAYRRRVVRYPALAILLAVPGFPIAGIAHVITNLSAWTTHGRVTDSSGERWVFCDSSFLQGQTMALARIERENAFFTRFKVVGTTNGDSPRSWASIVRPAHAQDEYGQLYLTDSEVLLGVRSDNRCFLAYDLVEQQLIGWGDIEMISPFICIGTADAMHLPDIATIERTMTELPPNAPGRPRRESLESALEHVNPAVREAAASLLQQSDEATPAGG